MRIATQTQRFRLAFITPGYAPQPKRFAGFVSALNVSVDVTEFGALDSVDEAELAMLSAQTAHFRISTERRDGSSILVSRLSIHTGIQKILTLLKPEDFDLAVIFCTGSFAPFPNFNSKCRILHTHAAMENMVSMLVPAGRKIGLVLPHASHLHEFELFGFSEYQRQMSWMDTVTMEGWEQVVDSAEECELVVLLAYYDDATVERLRTLTKRTVVTPHHVVATAIQFIFEAEEALPKREVSESVDPLLKRLSTRERQVMWLMIEGYQSKVIAEQLDISPRTVSIHRASILAKLQVPNTTALTRLILGRLGPPLMQV